MNLEGRIEWISEDTLEIRLGDPVAMETLFFAEMISHWIELERPAWLIDHCYGFGILSLVVHPALIDESRVMESLTQVLSRSLDGRDSSDSGVIEIPVCYASEFGLDLQSIGEATGLSVEQIIELHSSRDYRVLATGFVPGFGYLGETDPRIQLPRRDTPRTRIPPGSVAIAENQTVIYPTETPGGWNIIGRMPGSIVSVTRDSIDAKFAMGRLVRFQPISMDEFQAIEALDDSD